MCVCGAYFNAVCVDVQLCIAVVTVSLSLENDLKKKKVKLGEWASCTIDTHT